MYGLRNNIIASKQQLRFAIEAVFWLVYFMNNHKREEYAQQVDSIAQENIDRKTKNKKFRNFNRSTMEGKSGKVYQYCESIHPSATHEIMKYKDDTIDFIFAHSNPQNLENLHKIYRGNDTIIKMDYFDDPKMKEQIIPENIHAYAIIKCKMCVLTIFCFYKGIPK